MESIEHFDISAFLESGFIIERPFSNDIYLGQTLKKSPTGEIFTSNFYKTKLKRYSAERIFKINRNELNCIIEELKGQSVELDKTSTMDDLFMQDLRNIKGYFDSEPNLKKVVPVSIAKYRLKGSGHPFANLKKLRLLEGSIYGMWDKDKGVLGVSPEPLFVRENDYWKTRSLAGTISTGVSNYEEVLLSDKKEREEHLLVIKDIKSKLAPFVNRFTIGNTEVISFGKIAHLQTEIVFQSKEISGTDLVNILSPTAALGGFPHNLSEYYLKQLNYFNLEKDERYFGGVFGMDGENESFGLVGIRNILWNNIEKNATIHSGCGVVNASIPEKELSEIRNKRSTIESSFL